MTGLAKPAGGDAGRISAVDGGVEGEHSDDAAYGDRDAGCAEQGASRPAGGQPQPEQRRPGSLLEKLISVPQRFGARAASASAATVLVRAARMAGNERGGERHGERQGHDSDDHERRQRGGTRGADQSGAGVVRSGAVSHPAASPAAAASSARFRFSARNVAAIRPGVPPAAFSNPTRRVCSASRLPDQDGYAGDRQQGEEHGTGRSTDCSSVTSSPSAEAMSCHARSWGPDGPVLL